MKLVVLLVFVINTVVAAGFIWGVGSLVTSAVKSSTNSCGQTYPIEAIFSGSLLCPIVEESKNG